MCGMRERERGGSDKGGTAADRVILLWLSPSLSLSPFYCSRGLACSKMHVWCCAAEGGIYNGDGGGGLARTVRSGFFSPPLVAVTNTSPSSIRGTLHRRRKSNLIHVVCQTILLTYGKKGRKICFPLSAKVPLRYAIVFAKFRSFWSHSSAHGIAIQSRRPPSFSLSSS